jgi:hypothetical protein
MKNLLRKLVAPSSVRVNAKSADEDSPWRDEAIAAWSEVMGRDAAELWIAANTSNSSGRSTTAPVV